MSLLNAVTPILNTTTAKVALEVSTNPKVEGELIVVAKPLVGPVPNNAPHELEKLYQALATHLKAVGTPETIEAELYAVVSEQAGHRTAWASRAAEMELMIQQGAEKDTEKANSKAKPASKKAESKAKPEPEPSTPLAGETKGEKEAPKPSEEENLPLEL